MEKHLMTPEKTLMGKMFKKKWFRELLLLVPTITGARSSNKTEDYGIFKVSKLSHLQQLSIYVSDWGKSIKWYQTVAGLTVSRTCASEPHPTLAGHTIRCCYLSATRHPECLVLIEHKDEGGNIVKPTVHDFFHTAFELDGPEECCYDFDKEIRPVLKQNGYKGVSYGLVRHNSTPPDGDGESGGNVATYIYDPDLHFIEFFSGMDTVENYQQRYGNKTGSQRVSAPTIFCMKKYDIIIAGAGPVGLFAANVFGSYGYEVLLLEQHATRVNFPRAIALDSEIIRAVQSVGLADKLLEILKPTGGLQMFSSSGRLMVHIKTIVQDGYHPANLFYQPELEALLEDGTKRFENVRLLSFKLENIKYNEHEVVIECTNKESGESQQFTGSYLIGCDGANSSVRKALNIEEDDQKYEGAVLKIDAFEKQVKQKDQFFVEQFSSTKLPFIRMVGRNGHRRWEFPLVTESAPTKEKFENVAMAKSLLTKAGEQDIDNLDFRHVALYRYRSVVQRQWQRGRTFLTGDAAHLMPPFIGQGMCAGFRDIMNLGWKLDEVMRGISPEAILNTYQTEREPHYREQLGITIMVGKIYQSALWYIPGVLSKLPLISSLLKEVKTTLPPIGPGISLKSPGSRLVFPQCKVMIGGIEMWSDDYIGRHWALVSIEPLRREQQEKLESLGIRSFSPGQSLTSHGVMGEWLKKNKATCALVRPDRYVYSTAKNADQLIAQFTNYKKQK